MRVRDRQWLWYLAAVAAMAALYLAGPMNAGPVFNVIGASSAVAVIVGASPVSPPRARRLVRRSRSASCSSSPATSSRTTTSACSAASCRSRRSPTRSTSRCTRCSSSGLLALLRLSRPGPRPRRAPRRADHHGGSRDGLLGLPHGPYAHDGTLSAAELVTSLAYPIADVLLVAVAASLLLRRDRGASASNAGRQPPGAPRDRRPLRLAAAARRLRDGRPARRGLDRVLRARGRGGAAFVDARDLRAGEPSRGRSSESG